MGNDTATPYERAIAAGDREFRELADFAPAMLWRAGTDRYCDWVSRAWLEFTGRPLIDEVGEGWADGVHPDDLERCIATFSGSFHAREPFSMEYRLRHRDGDYRWVLDHGKPFWRDGRFAGYWGSCVDVTAHREAQQAQRLLVRELDHRVKNTLATVQAMVVQSFRDERPVDESLAAFQGRLHALAGAHDRLVTHGWEDVALRGVVATTVAPHDPGGSRIVVDGPALMVCPGTAVSIAMAVHELLTNATKYGALSTSVGSVTLGWTFDPTAGRLRVAWKERGGPLVTAPARRGFGVRFIERALASHAAGDAAVLFEPDGVRCHFELPACDPASSAARAVPTGLRP